MPFDAEHGPERLGTSLLLLALAAAIAFRLYLLLMLDFPINDGALFFEFVRAVATSFPELPTEVSYNGLVLPFAYPPLSFWLGALLTKMGVDAMSVIRTMPILMNVLYVLLFALVLLKSGRSRLFTALAILFFTVTLRAFEWLLMGGGLSRGLGSVFLMLTLLAVGVPDGTERRPLSRWRMVAGGAAVAGAILSHLEWGLLAAASLTLSRALGSRDVKDFLVSCSISGTTALVLIAPWLLFVQQDHGFSPFFSAGATSAWGFKVTVLRLLEFAVLSAKSNPLILAGGLVLWLKRKWFWIGFALLCAVLTPRHALTPLALAAAVFSAQAALSIYEAAAHRLSSRRVLNGLAAVLLGALLAHSAYRAAVDGRKSFAVLSQEARQAMSWVAQQQPGKRFAIINEQVWQSDRTGEWFPTLASARSVTTVQGREWNGEYGRWDEMFRALRRSSSCPELHRNLQGFGAYDFLWVETEHHCFPARAYRPVFSNSRVTIYQPSSASGT